MKNILISAVILTATMLTSSCPSTDGTLASSESIILLNEDAKIKGGSICEFTSCGNIFAWSYIDDEVTWDLVIKKPGDYTIIINVSCHANDPCLSGHPGSEAGLTVKGQTLKFVVPETGSWDEFRPITLGEMFLDTGSYKVILKAIKIVYSAPCENIAGIRSVIFLRK